MDRLVGMPAFRAATQDHGVAGLQTQRARIGSHIGPALVNDSDDAQRHAHALDAQSVGPVPFRHRRADRVLDGDDLLDAAGHRFDTLLIQAQSIEQCPAELRRAGSRHVAFVRFKDLCAAGADRGRSRNQRCVLLRGAGQCEHRGGLHSRLAEPCHQFAKMVIHTDSIDTHPRVSADPIAALPAGAAGFSCRMMTRLSR